ncbi:MAG: hypothetical protein IJP13_07740 [Lachnospiraceae bacterium]|nr:hypothetical protein [Lachnospiraceae bacterium]
MMKGKIDKYVFVSVALVTFVCLILPAAMALYSTYVSYDPAWPMAVAILVYMIMEPIVCGAVGVLYALKDKKPIIILLIMLVSDIILGFTLLDSIGLHIIFIPLVVFCLAYVFSYMYCKTSNKKIELN